MSCKPKRKVLFKNPDIVIFTLTWQPGDRGTIHRHSGSHMSLTKVLRGQIIETHFDKATDKYVESSSQFYSAGQVVQDGGLDAHRLSNGSNDITVTLHTEMPPMNEIQIPNEKIILWHKPITQPHT
ncbi:MAG: hypothetical protein HY226_05535 [Candidatus Vogelbacteria bacterium]|nr:hypothetical protein [Candidatus Vogelbacteria bacterium]